ncbi:MAG TPA: hypothetical protein VGD64_06195 [Acidisarcina sp.]
MRRALSIWMVVLFSLPLIAPAFASEAEANVPVCCRRHGVHHCMAMSSDPGKQSSVGAKCPMSAASSYTLQLHPVFAAQPQSAWSPMVAHPASKAQTEARYRIAFSRSRQKRGPPAAA